MAKPLKKFSAANISAAVWENEGKEGRPFFSVTLQKRYKDKNEEWKNSSSFTANDLPRAMLVLDKAYEFLVIKEDNSKEHELEQGIP